MKPALAVVVITGHATAEEIDDVKRLGAVDVIQKPSGLTHYHRAIERLHNRKAFPGPPCPEDATGRGGRARPRGR